MKEEIAIALFCLIEDVLSAYHHKRQRIKQEVMSDAEVIFAGILSARWFAGNFRNGLAHVNERKYCRKILSESRFLRRLKAISTDLWSILQAFLARAAGGYTDLWSILQAFLARAAGGYKAGEYVIDSFPCPVCHNVRIKRCRIVQGAQYHGYNASKKQYFYGLKVHAICSATGVPIHFEISPGSVTDITQFRNRNMETIEEGTLYADAAYTDYILEDQLKDAGLNMTVDRKKNSKRPHSLDVTREISRKRKKIETCFSGLMRLFPRTIHAVRLQGFKLKLILFLLHLPQL